MTLLFDFESVFACQFGLGRKGVLPVHVVVPCQPDVQGALREMAVQTWVTVDGQVEAPRVYEPSENYSRSEYLQVAITEEVSEPLRALHEEENFEISAAAIDDVSAIYYYFARMVDGNGQKMTAVRRAQYFKGVVGKPLIGLVSDSLRLVEDRVFKLDRDFDLLIDSNNIHILRPSAFEFIVDAQQAVRDAAPSNVAAIRQHLPFIEFENIEAYALTHTRAAQYLASIRAQGWMVGVEQGALEELCENTGVGLCIEGGKVKVSEEDILGFLEVVDRRRYPIELVRGSPERFRATGRQRVG